MRLNRLGQTRLLLREHLRHVVDSRLLDAGEPQQPLERQFDHFLRVPHDVGPTLGGEERVQRPQPRLSRPSQDGHGRGERE